MENLENNRVGTGVGTSASASTVHHGSAKPGVWWVRSVVNTVCIFYIEQHCLDTNEALNTISLGLACEFDRFADASRYAAFTVTHLSGATGNQTDLSFNNISTVTASTTMLQNETTTSMPEQGSNTFTGGEVFLLPGL